MFLESERKHKNTLFNREFGMLSCDETLLTETNVQISLGVIEAKSF